MPPCRLAPGGRSPPWAPHFLGGGVPVVPGLAPAQLPMARSPPAPMGQGWGGGAVLSKGGGREGEGRDLLFIFFFKFNL